MRLWSTFALLGAAILPAAAAYRAASLTPAIPLEAEGPSAWTTARLEERPSEPSRLADISLLPDGRGLAVGNQHRLWRTTDSGLTWRAAKSPLSSANGVVLRPDGVGLICDSGNHIMRTTDSGLTWSKTQAPDGSLNGCKVAFASAHIAIAIGISRVERSPDGGLTWTMLVDHSRNLFDVAFGSPVLGLVVGGAGQVLRTTDAGATWQSINIRTKVTLNAVEFLDSLTAVAVGTSGAIFKTFDGGQTWIPIASHTTQSLRAIAFSGPLSGVIAGTSGTVLRTNDGGLTWVAEASGTRAHLRGISMAPDGRSIAVGWYDTILSGPAHPTRARGPSRP